MEPRMNRAVISTAGQTLSPVQEQGIELDYVLPDYYPDVCKLIKCFVTPSVANESVSGDRLSYELRADVRILYCSEDSNVLQCVTQTLRFSRTATLPEGEIVSADVLAATDYVTCRAVSQRRLDVRGAITIRIRTVTAQQQEVLSDVFEKSVQLRRVPVRYPAKQLHTVRSILLSEELELGNTKPPVLHIVRCEARPVEQSSRIVSGKLMVQGSLQVQLLYACETDGDGSLEPMTFRLPYSQLVELDGLEEQDSVDVQCSAVCCDLKPVTDAAGEVRLLRCEAELRLACTAVRMASEMLVSDAFSTEHPCDVQTQMLSVSGEPVPFSETEALSLRLPCPDGELDCVYDAWCEVRSLNTESDAEGVTVSVMLCCYVLVRESSGMPRLLEQEEPFSHRLVLAEPAADADIRVQAAAENCSYTLSGASEVTVKVELHIEGTISRRTACAVLSGIQVQEDAQDTERYALKLYYGRAQEEIWEIAKRCRTSVEAIMEENDLTGEVLPENGMLLIPIVG